jgi:4-alpha-glucanotransferase
MNQIKEKILETSAKSQWELIGIKPHHGINIPLSSIHTKNSCGIGEFFDLIPLIDWCEELSLDVIQILPINDCGNDPSPYNGISASALNPIYLSLHKLPYLDKYPELKEKLCHLQKLTLIPRIPYQEVLLNKLTWLRDYFSQVAPQIMKSKGFSDFVAENGWVEPYALFRVLREKMGQYIWTTWPKEYQSPTYEEYERHVEDHFEEMAFYVVLQYLCFKQFVEIKHYANSHGVLLKGDIPILISPDSADVWHEPKLFDMSSGAGAPPDYYNPEGQSWGFPLYNWDMMRDTNYAWWRQRLKIATPLYDIYRIDHILGFFRIWAIPHGKPATEGHFVPEDEMLWVAQGKGILEMMLDTSPMLPIGEDLGLTMPLIRKTLEELGISGTRILRWERRWKADKSFIPLNDYPLISMTSVSTHDSETLALWWRDTSHEAKDFCTYKGWTYSPELKNDQRQEILWESHHTSSLFHINLLGEYLALFPEMVWPNIEDERINVPGFILPTNWTYRMRMSLEEITEHKKLKDTMRELVFSPTPPKVS